MPPLPPALSRRLHRPKATVATLAVATAIVVFTALWGMGVLDRYPLTSVIPVGLYGRWQFDVGPMLLASAAAGVALTTTLPRLMASLSTKQAAFAASGATLFWTTLLAANDGWAGLTSALEVKAGYRRTLPFISSGSEFVSTFTERVSEYTIHVKGHPPLFPLLLHWGETIGLDSARAEAIVLLLVGASSTAAIIGVISLLSDGPTARSVAPLLAVTPAVVYMGVSPDGLITAVLAWTTFAATYAFRRSTTGSIVASGFAGLGAGATMYLTYGAPLFLIAPAALLLMSRSRIKMLVSGVAAMTVAATFTLAGFWWLDGLDLVRQFYVEGKAADRPYWFFGIANLTVAILCVGPAVLAGFANLKRGPLWIVGGAAIAGILLADLSGMSKAEVERIWLPLYALASVALAGLPGTMQSVRRWMIPQVLLGLILQAGVVGSW